MENTFRLNSCSREIYGCISQVLLGIIQSAYLHALGIQEYVEAASFLHYIRHRSLISLEEINARLVFMKSEKEDSEVT